MKKIIFAMLLLVVNFCFKAQAASLEEIKQRGYIKVSTNAEFDPFEYIEGDDIIGIDIDIAKNVAKKLGVELRINDISFDGLILELSNKTCDFVIAAMSESEEKSKSVDFSESYYTAKQMIVVLNSSDIKSAEDLVGKKIGVQFGCSGALYCSEHYGESNIVTYTKITDAGFDLQNKTLDAIVVDDLPAKKLLKMLGNSAKVIEDSLFEEHYKVAVPKGETELLNFINLTINTMKQNKDIDKIVDKYTDNSNDQNESLKAQIYNNLIKKERYKIILQGLSATLKMTSVALMIGIVIGVLIALIKVNTSKGWLFKILKFLANAYVLIIRGTPVVVQLFVVSFLILTSSGLSKLVIAMITFGINSGAYVSEIIRSGILSIDKGQYEAGRCLGLSNRTTMMKIILPQAFRNILPTLAGEFIQLIKETSVAGLIGIVDLSRAGDIIRSNTYQPLVPLISVAIIYLVMVSGLTYLLSFLERRLKICDKN